MPYFHVRITPAQTSRQRLDDEVKLDLTIEDLEHRILEPYRKGRPITIRGKSIAPDTIERLRITRTDQDSTQLRPIIEQERKAGRILWVTSIDWGIADSGEDVTDDFITGPPGPAPDTIPHSNQDLKPAADAREVFVVHGRNSAARDALFEFLRAIDLHPLEWSEAVQYTGKASPYVGEVLDAAFSRAHAVVVLFTPDDEARLKESFRTDGEPPHEAQLTGQARPNVLFEAGMAMARNQDRTILIELGSLRWFSDIGGRHTVRLDDTSQRRQDLAQRLEAAGCPVNLTGTDWHTAGDFETAIPQESSDLARIAEQQVQIPEPPPLSEEAEVLLVEAAKDSVRMIHKVRYMNGTSITTNNRELCERGNSRSEARWEQAIRDLLLQGLIEDPKGSGETFEVTHKGFQTADEIQKSQQ